MSAILRTLKKPYDCVSTLIFSSKAQRDISPSERSNVFHSILSPFETYVVSLQSLLIWERPYLSAGALLSLNILYWLIVSWNRRFVSIVSMFTIGIFLYRTWIKSIWPEIRVPLPEGEDTESWTTVNPDVLSVPELSQYINDLVNRMILLYKDVWKLRRENRGMFCCLMCGFFSFMAFIGKVFPGVLIVYFLVLSITLGPGVALHLIPSTVYDQIIDYFSDSDSQVSPSASKSVGFSDKDSDLDEFVPEVSAEVIRQLSLKDESPDIPSPGRVLLDPLAPDESNDSYRSDDFSLYQGLGSFPSVEEEGESDIEEDLSENLASVPLPSDLRTTDMHFDPSHFKDDSSDSESDAFAEGLRFDQQSRESSVEKTVVTSTGKQQLYPDLEEDELMDFEILEDTDIPT